METFSLVLTVIKYCLLSRYNHLKVAVIWSGFIYQSCFHFSLCGIILNICGVIHRVPYLAVGYINRTLS